MPLKLLFKKEKDLKRDREKISKDFYKYTLHGGRGTMWAFVANLKMTFIEKKYSEYNFL